MRAIFSVLGLLVVLAIVGVLVKQQLGSGATSTPARTQEPGTAISAPAGSPGGQVRQVEQAVQGAMQQARPMPDEGK